MKPFELKEHLDKVNIDHRDVRRVCWYVPHEWDYWWHYAEPYKRISYYYEYCLELYEPINGCHFVVVLEQQWRKPELRYYAYEPPKPLKKEITNKTYSRERKQKEPRIKKKKTKKGFFGRNLREDDPTIPIHYHWCFSCHKKSFDECTCDYIEEETMCSECIYADLYGSYEECW